MAAVRASYLDWQPLLEPGQIYSQPAAPQYPCLDHGRLYFIDQLLGELRESKLADQLNWKTVDAFRKFGGIRVEDDVRVLADGVENLTRDGFARSSDNKA